MIKMIVSYSTLMLFCHAECHVVLFPTEICTCVQTMINSVFLISFTSDIDLLSFDVGIFEDDVGNCHNTIISMTK